MASLFSPPKVSKPTPPEPAPPPMSVDQDLVDQQTRDRLRKRKGRASTILNTGSGPGGQPMKKQLGPG